jgi:non-ribosomal peptide synthase protein (TIGR01720 family)
MLESTRSPSLQKLRWLIPTGEALPVELCRGWLQRYPHVPLLNAYGPTECSDDVAHYAISEPPAEKSRSIPIGKAIPNLRLYVLDRSLHPMPVGVSGELYVGGVGVGRGYRNDPQRTAEAFVPDPFSQEAGTRLYRTGDRVRYRSDGNIEYLGRVDQQVKLRGYRIELGEIEAALRAHPAVQDAVVLMREDVPGEKRLVAYPVVQAGQRLSVSELRAYLQGHLPSYMVPSTCVFLESLPLLPNGKVDRRALPLPQGARPELAETFLAPRTSLETALASLWSQVLRVKQVGIHDNFFALGGDSILSLQVVARARQAGLLLTPKQIFQYQTIAQLAHVVTTSTRASTSQALVTGPVELTPIQHWFFARHLPEPHHFNQSLLLKTQHPLRLRWLQQALLQLVLYHDALRLRFVQHGESWQQELAGRPSHHILLTVDLSGLPHEEQPSVMTKLAASAQASLDLGAGLLLCALFFISGADHPDHLLLIVHHLAVDGISWRILKEDLETVYWQLAREEQVHLAEKTTSWQQWSQKLWQYARSELLRSEMHYWLAPQRKQVVPLPVDIPVASNTVATQATINVSLAAEQTQALLQQVPRAYHTQINEVLLTALLQTFSEWTGQPRSLIDLEDHGREEVGEEVDLSRTVGWFTTLFPVLLDGEQATDPGEALKAVKEQLRSVPQKGLGYGLLRYLSQDPDIAEQFASLPQAEVVFNYLGQFDTSFHGQSLFHAANVSTGPAYSPLQPRSHLLEINASVVGGRLHLAWHYSRSVHHQETIQKLARRFIEALADLITHCQSPEVGGYTPSDFPLAGLDQPQLDWLIQQLPRSEGKRPGELIEDIYPLSPMQAGLLFQCLYAPEIGVYCMQFDWTIQGMLNENAWRQAWQYVINRHPILRTFFIWQSLQQPLQVVSKQVELPCEIHDWRSLSAQEQQHNLALLRQKNELKSVDFSRAPLLRLALARLGEQTYHFHLSLHHLIIDGWSQSLLLREVQECYQTFCLGRVPDLPPVHPYRDYLAWLQQQDLHQAEAFWRTYLSGFTTPNQLPGYRESANPTRMQTATQQIQCSAVLTSSLQEQAQQLQLTLNTLLQGAWA